jgi:uncharacterized protein (DUF2062 family)
LPNFIKLKKYLFNKTIEPLLGFLKQGMTAEKIALTLTLGLSIGIMPLMGFTTLLLALLALVFRLNLVAIQIVHYSVTIIQVALFVPFLKLGQFIFQLPELPFNINNIPELIQTRFVDTFLSIWQINLMGIVVWLIIAIPLGLVIYRLSLAFFSRQKQKMELEIVSVNAN